MGKRRDFGLLAVLVAAVPFAAFAVRLPYDAGFGGECAEDGRPKNWEFHMYEGYLPKADVTVVDEPGVGKVLHYRNVRGKRGSSIYTVQRRPGRDGDIVSVSVMARGSGKAFVDLYCWGGDGKKFIRTLPEKHAALTPEWKTHEFQFTLEDHEVNGKTESFAVAIGIAPGADAYFHDVRVSRALEASESLDMDDFEKPAERAGSPEIISDNIAPGLLVETRQGVYRTQNVVEVSPAKAYAIPKGECSFLSAGVRIYGFGDDRSVSSGLLTKFACGTNRVVVAVRSSANMDDLACILFENGCRTASWPVPRKVLPADFTASVGADGTVNVAVTSLSDSSSRDFTAEAACLRGASGEVAVSRSLVSGGGMAEATIDNLSVAVSSMKRIADIEYPYTADPKPTFDPEAAGWPLVFSDEFDGTEVDTNKWVFTGEKWKRDYAALSGDGRLLIKADYRPGSDALGTACLRSRTAFLHGYFEARVKFTRERGWWAAFWLCSYGIDNPFANGMEIDIFEDYYIRAKPGEAESRRTLDHNLHIKGTDVLKSYNYNSTLPGSLDEFYTIGCKWTPWEISYYLNGKLMSSKATHSPYDSVTFDAFRHGTSIMPLHAIVSGQVMSKGYGALSDKTGSRFPEFYEVDYVRIYALPGDAEGMKPEVTARDMHGKRVFVREGDVLLFRADARPAANTGSPIKAVYLFDDGYCLGVSRKEPYEFKVPFAETWFAKTAWMRPGRSKVQPKFGGSLHAFSLFAEDENGNVGFTPPKFMMPKPPVPSRPYAGTPQAIPGTIAVGRYDEGGEGVAYHDTTKGNSQSKAWRTEGDVDCTEHDVGSLSGGEWLRYTVDVAEAGDYRVMFTYGTSYPGRHLAVFLCDDEEVGRIELPRHEYGDDWSVTSKRETVIRLPAGRHSLTVLTLGLFNYSDIVVEGVQGRCPGKTLH